MSLQELKTVINDIIDDYNLDILLLVCVILFGIYIFMIAPILYVPTTDAVIDGKLINIPSRVSGQIIQVYAMKDQEVKKGDILIEIDSTDYKNELIKLETSLEINKQKLQMLTNEEYNNDNDVLNRNTSNPPKYKYGSNNITNYSKTYEPENVAETNIARKKIALGDVIQNMSDINSSETNGRAEVNSQENIRNNEINKNTNSDTSEINVDTSVDISIPKPMIDKSKIDITNDTVESVKKSIKEIEQQEEEIKLLIYSTKIFAPRDGVVSAVSVNTGDVVNPSDILCTIIPKQVWVIARVNPVKLPQIQVGQSVKIKIKEYKNRTFKGTVTSVDKTKKVYQIKPEEEIIQVDTNGQIINKPTPAYQIKIDFIEDYSDFNLPPDTEVFAKIKVRTIF